MSDPTPPPEEPLGEQARARIRADLMAATREPSGRSRRWAVPVAAAASVALVAGVTAWATGLVGEDATDRGGPGPASGTSATPTPAPTEPGPDTPTSDDGTVPSEAPTAPTPDAPTPTSTPTSTPDGGTQPGSSTCPPEFRYVLRGAGLAATYPDDPSTSYWVKGDRFSLCDARDGATTVHQPLPLEPDFSDVATWRVSSLFPPTEDGYEAVRVAGGVVPEGLTAFDVAYTFPDGHTERATTFEDDAGRTWWRMLYVYDPGPGNEFRKPPIEVTYSLSGVQETFTLEWAVDTCAQANHGC